MGRVTYQLRNDIGSVSNTAVSWDFDALDVFISTTSSADNDDDNNNDGSRRLDALDVSITRNWTVKMKS